MLESVVSVDNVSVESLKEIFLKAKEIQALHSVGVGNDIAKKNGSKNIVTLFFENSTRTKYSFHLAAKKCGFNITDVSVQSSSLNKGESEISTIRNVCALNPDCLIIRHGKSGAINLFKKYIPHNIKVINAGDGSNEHPTQALADSFFIEQKMGRLSDLNISIVGDLKHSRVANSLLKILTRFSNNITLVSPIGLMLNGKDYSDVNKTHNFIKGVSKEDIVIFLRTQNERISTSEKPSMLDIKKYFSINRSNITQLKPNCLIMHPGPVLEDLEIESALLHTNKFSNIISQVEAGLYVRMALLTLMLSS